MQPRFVTGALVKSTHGSALNTMTGIVVSVKETNTSSVGSLANWYPHVYYVFFNDNVVRGPLFSTDLTGL